MNTKKNLVKVLVLICFIILFLTVIILLILRNKPEEKTPEDLYGEYLIGVQPEVELVVENPVTYGEEDSEGMTESERQVYEYIPGIRDLNIVSVDKTLDLGEFEQYTILYEDGLEYCVTWDNGEITHVLLEQIEDLGLEPVE